MNYTTIRNTTDLETDNIFSALIDPALIYGTDLTVKKVNCSFVETYKCNPTGLNLKDVISMFSCRWLDESRYQLKEQPTARALKGEKNSGSIFSITVKGSESFVETSSSPIYSAGVITGALTIWRKIDDPVRIQNALLRSEEIHRKIDDHSPVGIIINKNGVIEYANNAALKFLGARHLLDIEGKTVFDFFSQGSDRIFKKPIGNLHPGKIIEESEHRIKRLDGEEREAEVTVINTSEGDKEEFHIFLRDITSEKKLNLFHNVLSLLEQALQRSVDTELITGQTMEMTARALNCDSAAVYFLYDGYWEAKHVYKFAVSEKDKQIPVDDEPQATLALKENKIIFIEDASSDTRVNNERMKEFGIRSVVVIPLYTRSKKIGVITCNFIRKKIFNHEEIYFLIRVSNSLSLSLENSELFGNLEAELAIKRANELKLIKLNNILLAISRSSQALVQSAGERDYVSKICSIVTSICGQDLAWVGFLDGKTVIPRIWAGTAKNYINKLKLKIGRESLSGPTGMALKSRKSFVCNNISEDRDLKLCCEDALAFGLRSVVSLPLIHDEKVFGVMNLYSRETDFYTEDEVKLLSELANYISQGIIFIRLGAAKRKADDSLRESEERFRMLTEKSNALICELDPIGRVLYANARYLDIFGWSEPFSGSILDTCKPAERVSFNNYIYNPELKISKTEWMLKDKNNVWRWFRCHPGLFKTSGGGRHYSLVMFDISETKLQEQQLEKNARELKDLNATKDKFFAIIAHDLKNPFANLIGASELLANGSGVDQETVKKLGKIINSSATRGFNLLQNLLEWSRSQTGAISFIPEKVILEDLVKDCTDGLKSSACVKNHKTEIIVPGNLEIMADINMLNTIIRNLLQNAIKFTPDNGLIRLIAKRNKTGVAVSVEDNGIGLSADNIKKLFRPDVKFSTPGTNRETGTGLGLLLCREFVEKHGGRLWVKSKEGQGSKFTFNIPAKLP